jgi:hypothetical protein
MTPLTFEVARLLTLKAIRAHLWWGRRTPMAVAVATATGKCLRLGAAVTVAAAAVAALLRVCRGGDRQRADARGEKHPGQHRKISSRTGTTV